MIGTYTFLPLEKVIHGPGSVGQLAQEVERLGSQRAFVVTGRTLATETPLIRRVEEILGSRHAGTYTGIRQHAPESGIAEAAQRAGQAEVDLLVSVGGGSPIDASKAVARKLASEAEAPFPPHIAIPTTLSAAEFSHMAGYTDEKLKAKTGFRDPRATPRTVILDPEMTLFTPAWLWSSSGIRALDHAVETLYSPGEHPVNDVLALEAIADLFKYLPLAKADPEDVAARGRCQLAAWMSFFGPATVQYGLSHALGRLVGATHSVPHGVTSCIFLAHVMRHKAPVEARRLAPVANRLGLVGDNVTELEAALAAADAVADLVRRLELPRRLRDVDVPEDALEAIAFAVAGRTPERSAILELLARAW